MTMAQRTLSPDAYTVGWISALPVEFAAAVQLLDEEHSDHPLNQDHDTLYTLGSIGKHNVVIACLPAGSMGTNSAAAVATQMKAQFPSVRFGLLVGIGGGVPGVIADIRLGDVVVSQPSARSGGVIQYDFGKSTPDGFARTGFLSPPPKLLLSALSKMQAQSLRGRSVFTSHLSRFDGISEFKREHAGPDMLFDSKYDHVGGPTCDGCDQKQLVRRTPGRGENQVKAHYGMIASGNMVMRSAQARDHLSSELGGVLCFEMEAAGLMNGFPCLVIRGICDYADSHKNKTWQPYAAATAAAYAKELLLTIPGTVQDRGGSLAQGHEPDIGPTISSEKRRYTEPITNVRVSADNNSGFIMGANYGSISGSNSLGRFL
ncbi:nucleoside phosphorylase domain-containing protein [Trichoderma sp. SZMC 28012]